MNVIFVDKAKDVKKAIELTCPKKDIIVALTTCVMWELEKKRYPFKIPYDYYNVKKLSALNEDLYILTEGVANYLNKKMQLWELTPKVDTRIEPIIIEEKILKDAASSMAQEVSEHGIKV